MKNKKYVAISVSDSLQKAREIEAKIKSELVSGEYYNRRKATYTLEEVWSRYLESYKARGKAWRAEERRYNQYLKPKFGKKTLVGISPFDIESLSITLSKSETKYGTPYSPKSIKNIIDLLSVIFNYAKAMGLYEGNNPCERVKRPKINNEVLNILSLDQLRNLIVFLNGYECRPIANLIKFLIFTGVRLGEAFKLTFNDVNLMTKIITLRDPKGGKDQYLYLNESAIMVLKDQLNYRHPGTPLVFPNKDGKIRTEIGERWLSIKKQAGVPLNMRCHDLRHQFASLLASSGKVDPYTVQKLLTHKDFKTTQRYAHLFPQTLLESTKIIDEILKNDENDEKQKSTDKKIDVAYNPDSILLEFVI
jgi:integrase